MKFRHLAASLLFTTLFLGCRFMDPKDVDGNGPEDAARRFVELARSGDISGAASCWREGDTANLETNRKESFAQFCAYFRSESYRLQYEGWDGDICWIRFFGTDDGKTRARLLFLDPPHASKDGRWKLRESLWIKESNR